MRRKIEGICRICQKYGKLSREHVPPRGAFNSDSFKIQGVNEHKSAKGELVWYETWKHGGNVRYVTCEDCNNFAGSWYAPEYIKFIDLIKPYAHPYNIGIVETDHIGFYPLPVIKQVMYNFLAIINPDQNRKLSAACAPSAKRDANLPPPELFMDVSQADKVLPAIRRFVLDREWIGLPEGLRLYAYLVGERAGRSSSITVRGERDTGKVAILSEFAWWPIGWLLLFDGQFSERLLDVTEWADCRFDTRFSVRIGIPCYWLRGKFPLDFRYPMRVDEDTQREQVIAGRR